MNRTMALRCLLVVGLTGLAGCVHPGEIDVTLINQYQQKMAGRGPQRRAGRKGLDLLRPAEGQAVPPLKVEDIFVTQTIETISDYQHIEKKDDFEKVRLALTTKTTTYFRDPQTGKITSEVKVEDSNAPINYQRIPKSSTTLEVHREGAESKLLALLPNSRKLVRLSLDEAILRALTNNMDIRVQSFEPAIAREEMVRAAAVFDYTVFGEIGLEKNERKAANRFSGEIERNREATFGVRNHAVTGADWSLAWAMSRNWDSSSFTSLRTRWEPTVVLQVTQPLLRNAWPEFNLARVRIARLNTKITESDFRARVEEVLVGPSNAEPALLVGPRVRREPGVIDTYWGLVRARRDLAIQQKLLSITRTTFRRVIARHIIDASMPIIKQVEASVRRREADLIRAQKLVQDMQDSLARLLADEQINSLSKLEIATTTEPIDQMLHANATEQLLLALRHNPRLEQARLAIAAAKINVSVAKNQALPSLNFVGSTGIQGLGSNLHTAYDRLLTGDYHSWAAKLELEYPIGNRDRIANLRQRKFEHTRAIAQMQNVADQVAVAVNTAIRRLETTHREIAAWRGAMEASAVHLKALEDTERIRGRLTPEWFQLKLRTQEDLAFSARGEIQALVDYNNALAQLSRNTGTVLELQRVKVALPSVVEAEGNN